MKTFDEIKETLGKHKSELNEKYGVIKMGVFGSFARSKQREDSGL